ncbi:hypothetical protein G6F68_020254 [Rhizopus microsporus]|nr:hypothetical protein G6F68_020254 [Rhizopus microsporus]
MDRRAARAFRRALDHVALCVARRDWGRTGRHRSSARRQAGRHRTFHARTASDAVRPGLPGQARGAAAPSVSRPVARQPRSGCAGAARRGAAGTRACARREGRQGHVRLCGVGRVDLAALR